MACRCIQAFGWACARLAGGESAGNGLRGHTRHPGLARLSVHGLAESVRRGRVCGQALAGIWFRSGWFVFGGFLVKRSVLHHFAAFKAVLPECKAPAQMGAPLKAGSAVANSIHSNAALINPVQNHRSRPFFRAHALRGEKDGRFGSGLVD